jgi:hypothetical protein
VIVPDPNGLDRVSVPSDQRVIVPDPNFCVLPVTVFPSARRSVVIDPEPKGLVCALDPSERRVIDPDPNRLVVPVRGPASPIRGGVGGCSAAAESAASNTTTIPLKRQRGMANE